MTNDEQAFYNLYMQWFSKAHLTRDTFAIYAYLTNFQKPSNDRFLKAISAVYIQFDPELKEVCDRLQLNKRKCFQKTK